MQNQRYTSISRDHLELLALASQSATNDLASKLARLKAHVATLEAELKRYRVTGSSLAGVLEERAKQLQADNALLGESVADALRRLQQREADLAQAQTEVADLTQEVRRIRAECDYIVKHAEDPEEYTRAAEKDATNAARRPLLERDVELAQLCSELAALTAENERFRSDRSVILQRAARIEEHNHLLVESTTTREVKLQQQERELTRNYIEVATLTSENTRLRAEHAFYAKRAAELEEHNEQLTESATETARKLQQCQLTLAHNQLVVQEVYDLREHNRLLTESATEMARKLQEIRQTDYQLLMAHQQLLAGMKDAEPRFAEIYEKCRAYTMTSVERLYALYKSVEYIVSANIPGDFAEAGVWQGGSCMLIAETLTALGDRSRRIFLFDTFEGHPKPDAERDVDLWGNRAIDEWKRAVGDDSHGNWAYVSLEDVQANLARTGYPADRLVFVKGLVEETAANVPSIEKLALLRLDTDWYASTRTGLQYLYPRLAPGGILIVDDYGHYKGQQEAVDEYFAAGQQPILLNRIDYSCRLGVKR